MKLAFEEIAKRKKNLPCVIISIYGTYQKLVPTFWILVNTWIKIRNLKIKCIYHQNPDPDPQILLSQTTTISKRDLNFLVSCATLALVTRLELKRSWDWGKFFLSFTEAQSRAFSTFNFFSLICRLLQLRRLKRWRRQLVKLKNYKRLCSIF